MTQLEFLHMANDLLCDFDKKVEDGVTAATFEASEHLVYVTGAELSLE